MAVGYMFKYCCLANILGGMSAKAKLRKEFIELLEEDVEFRYIVAGYLGFSETLRRLDELRESQNRIWMEIREIWKEVKALREESRRLWEEVKTLRENQERMWKNQEKLWMEVRALREGQTKLWEEVRALRENQEKLWEENRRLWEEVKALRENQERMWKNQEKLWMEVRALREGQEKLWKSQEKLWEEVKALRENQERMWQSQERLWEENRRIWEEIRALRRNQDRMWRELRRLRTGLEELSMAVGVSLENYTVAFVKLLLEDLGYPEEKIRVGRKILVYKGEPVEINVFNEDPLIVGEVTTFIGSVEAAEKEVNKLLFRIRIVEEKYGRSVEMSFLAVENAEKDALERLKQLCEEHGIRLIYGKEIRTW